MTITTFVCRCTYYECLHVCVVYISVNAVWIASGVSQKQSCGREMGTAHWTQLSSGTDETTSNQRDMKKRRHTQIYDRKELTKDARRVVCDVFTALYWLVHLTYDADCGGWQAWCLPRQLSGWMGVCMFVLLQFLCYHGGKIEQTRSQTLHLESANGVWESRPAAPVSLL